MPTSTGTRPEMNNVENFLTNQYLDDLANIGNGFRIKQIVNPSQAITQGQVNDKREGDQNAKCLT
jgi:hypothetical protein